MRNFFRKTGRIALWGLAVALGLVLLVVVLVQTPLVKDWLRTEVVERANETLEGRLEIERLSGSLIRSLTLHEITLRDGRGRPVAEIEGASATYWLPSLLANGLQIDEVDLDAPRVLVRRYEDGTLNLETLTRQRPDEEPPGDPSDFRLPIDDYEIRGGVVVWQDLQMLAEQTDLADRRLEALVEAADEAIVAPSKETNGGDDVRPALAAFASEIEQVRRARTAPPAMVLADELALEGAVEMTVRPRIDNRLESLQARLRTDTLPEAHDLSVSNLRTLFGTEHLETNLERLELTPGLELTGTEITAELSPAGAEGGLERFAGDLGELQVAGEILEPFVEGVDWRSDLVLTGRLGGSPSDVYARSRVQFEGAGTIEAGGRLDLRDEKPGYRAHLLGEDLRADEIVDAGQPPARLNLAARLEGTGTAPAEANGVAEAAVWNSAVDGIAVDTLSTRLSAEAGSYRLRHLTLESSHLDAAARGRFDRSGDFALRARTRSSDDEELSAENLGLSEGPPLRLERADLDLSATGSLDLEAGSPGEYLDRADVDGSWALRGIRLGEVRLRRSEGNLQLDARPDGTESRSVDVSAHGSGSGFRAGDLSLQRGRFDLDASGTVDRRADRAADALADLRTSWSVRGVGLRSGSLQIGRASAGGDLAAAPKRRTYTAGVELEVGAVRAGGLRIDGVSAEADNRFVLSSDLSAPIPIERLSTSGESTLETLAASGLAVDRTQVAFAFEGPPTDPVGDLAVRATDLDIAGREFTDVRLDVETETGRALEAELAARPVLEPDRPFLFETSLEYGPELAQFHFETLSLGRPDQTWRLRDPSTVEIGAGSVSVAAFRLDNGPQSIALDGTYRQRGRQSLSVDIDRFDIGAAQDLAGYHPIADLDGRVDLSASLAGTHLDPRLDLSVEADRLTAFEYGPFAFQIDLDSDGRSVTLETFRLNAGEHPLAEATAALPLAWNLTGDTDFDLHRPARLDLVLEETSLAQLDPVLPETRFDSIGGQAAGSFEFRGSVADPTVDFQFDLRNFALEGEVNGATIDLSQTASSTSFRYGARGPDQPRIAFDSEISWRDERTFGLEFRTDAALIEWGVAYSEGRLPADELLDRLIRTPLELALQLEETEVGQLPFEIVRETDAEGLVTAELTLDGTLLEPDSQAHVDLDDFGWNQYRDIFVDLQASFADRMLTLDEFRIEWDADEILAARGRVPIPSKALVENRSMENLPIDFTLELKPIDVDKLSAIDYAFTQIQGTITGHLRLGGTLRSPKIESRLAVVDALFSDDFRGTAAIWLWTDEGRLRGGTMACREAQPILTGQYDLPVDLDLIELAAGGSPLADGPLEASLEGSNVPVEQLVPMPLLDEWIAAPEGYLQIDLGLEGTWEQPQPYGSLGLEEGAVTIIEYGRRFRNIRLATRLDEERFTLRKFHLEDIDGALDVSGTTQLDGLMPTEFSAEATTDEFNIAGLATDFPASVTSETEISGERVGESLRADIDVTDLNVEITEADQQGTHPTDLSGDIVVTEADDIEDATKISEYLTEGTTGGGLSNIQFDVEVERDSFVRHSNGYLNFSADISGQLQGGQTILTGQVDSIRGEFEFLGRQFQIPRRETIVQFTGASPPNPRLDVMANYPLPSNVVAELPPPVPEDPAIQVQVTGNATNPNLEMTSDPTMSETDIVFVLMTGRAPTTAGVGESQGVASQAAAAAGGIFAGLLQQQLSQTIPVDVLRFEAGEGGLAGSQLRVGKYITSELFVSYAQKLGTGEDAGYEARVEYHFLPSWMIEAQYGENQTGALNIFWDLY